ncbi:TetR/AcrR family transcriptional regulator [Litchfieldia salsa]|uniref:DNA-binding transcriptional regulator, AcrR family n=1 Tax=Litchfieldia salsa TaxID=930152 RepID=A0A1H0Q5Y5_9BACI|nr:TetR/AcrR family transcriptional regulator [Litchfieldia salsa]SDP12812.1 DNA-binding transcriptional regulator, AcrR family [Litchfieldia salsa]
MSEHQDEKVIGEYPYVPKQQRAQAKRQALLESGRLLFIEQGYEQTNAKEIAAHAGVATGTFYRYFVDKRQLMMSLMNEQLDRLLPPIHDWTTNNPESYLAIRLEEHYKQLDQLNLNLLLPELLVKDSQLAELFEEIRSKMLRRIISNLRSAKKQGLVWDDLNVETVAWSILLLSEQIPEAMIQGRKKEDFQHLAKVICRLVFPPEKLEQLKTNK